MSIIYDALKKIENAAGSKISEGPKKMVNKTLKAPKRRTFLTYALGIALVIFIGSLFFSAANSKKGSSGRAQAKKVKVSLVPPFYTVDEISSRLVLNGVFFSDNRGYALINNEIVQEGDLLDGAQVISIKSAGVELDVDGEKILLSTESS